MNHNQSEDKIIITVDLPDEPATVSMSLVLRHLRNKRNPWAVHYLDRTNDSKFKSRGYFQGSYFSTQEEALEEFQSRLQENLNRYKPWIKGFFGLRDLIFRLNKDIYQSLIDLNIIEGRENKK